MSTSSILYASPFPSFSFIKRKKIGLPPTTTHTHSFMACLIVLIQQMASYLLVSREDCSTLLAGIYTYMYRNLYIYIYIRIYISHFVGNRNGLYAYISTIFQWFHPLPRGTLHSYYWLITEGSTRNKFYPIFSSFFSPHPSLLKHRKKKENVFRAPALVDVRVCVCVWFFIFSWFPLCFFFFFSFPFQVYFKPKESIYFSRR